MPMTTGEVWDRISALVVAQGYTRALNSFDFEQQPDTNLEKAFCLSSTRVGATSYIGGAESPQHRFDIYLALKCKRDAWGAVRQLKVDADVVLAAVQADYPAYDYIVLDTPMPGSECQKPGPEKDFAIALVTFVVEFDA